MDLKEDYSDLLSSEKSPLNTSLDDSLTGCSKDQTEFTSDEDDIPSSQPPVKPSGKPEKTAKQQRDRENRKRKADENLYSLEAKIKRTEESIKCFKSTWRTRLVPSHYDIARGLTSRRTNRLRKTFWRSNRKQNKVSFQL